MRKRGRKWIEKRGFYFIYVGDEKKAAGKLEGHSIVVVRSGGRRPLVRDPPN